MVRDKAFRTHKRLAKMQRRLKEIGDNDFWHSDKGRNLIADTPKVCSHYCCGNRRKRDGLSIQERRHTSDINEGRNYITG
jgi:hypothetical protein